jgi:hypothetical protein
MMKESELSRSPGRIHIILDSGAQSILEKIPKHSFAAVINDLQAQNMYQW